MTDRFAAVLPFRPPTPLAPPEPSGGPGVPGAPGTPALPVAPPGVDEIEFRWALLEDTYEVIADLEGVTPAVHVTAAEVAWPGTAELTATTPHAVFAELAGLGAGQGVVVAPDAPDLPPLLIGKLFRALGRAEAAACRARGGGLVALAVRLPLAGPLGTVLSTCDLDTPDLFERLQAAVPRPGLVQAGPGWHRIRAPIDVSLLDPGLEGWENTRGLLSRGRRPGAPAGAEHRRSTPAVPPPETTADRRTRR